MRNYLFLAAAAVSLGACASGGGTALQKLSGDLAASARISEIAVTHTAGLDVSSNFSGIVKAKLEEKLQACTAGDRSLKLAVDITAFKRANPAMTWLLADANQIGGNVKLVDPASGAVVGSYVVNRSFAASGLIGVAMTSQPEEQMGEAFGGEVCKTVFNKPVK